MTEHHVTDEQYAAALAAGRSAEETEFRAKAVFYIRDRDAIEVMTGKDGGFVIPRRLIGALQDVAATDLAKMELWPDGSLIEIEHLDIHIAVDGMIKAALPVLVPGPVIAGLFATYGGSARSEAKAASSRKNGKKGGRPKKKAA